MATRDASRIRIKFPDLDYDGDGAVDALSAFFLCIFDGPNWSGFSKPSIKTTISCDVADLDDWGNLIETLRSGKVVKHGSLTVKVDWDPNETTKGGKALAAFYADSYGNYEIYIPANAGETTGPILTIPGTVSMFKPEGTVVTEDDNARLSAELTLDLAGAMVITAAVSPP